MRREGGGEGKEGEGGCKNARDARPAELQFLHWNDAGLAERRDEVAGGAEEGGELYTGSNATSRCPSGKALTGSLLDPPDAGAATAAPPAPVSTDQRAAFRSAMLCPRRLESTWRYPDPAGCSGEDPAPGMACDGLDAGCKCGVEGEEELLAERWWCAPW